jgi:hypothetical protein
MSADNTNNNEAEQRFDINAKATPEEIMAAYKQQLQAKGQDVDEVFVQQHLGQR